MKKLKKAILREELVELTGDFRIAIVLNQFIYWSQRVNDFDNFIAEENERIEKFKDGEKFELTNGWIYKTAEELKDECMFVTMKKEVSTKVKDATILQYIDYLVKNNWLERRNNPKYKWDRTYQYRVNLLKIISDLLPLGYILQDYKVPLALIISQLQKSKMQHTQNENAYSKNENQASNFENQDSKNENETSNFEEQYQKLHTETTTETTTTTTTDVVFELIQQVKNIIPNVSLDDCKNILKVYGNNIEKIKKAYIYTCKQSHSKTIKNIVGYIISLKDSNLENISLDNSTFNNFEQRKYGDDDINVLEKKLLGWEN